RLSRAAAFPCRPKRDQRRDREPGRSGRRISARARPLKYALALVDINPESRVKVAPGPAKPELVEAGTRIFLVKVNNAAGVTAKLEVDSPNAAPVYIRS